MAEDGQAIEGGRSLLALDQGRTGPAPVARPSAAFLTQLLACRDGTPAYRTNRRAEPAAAAASYAATALVTKRRCAA